MSSLSTVEARLPPGFRFHPRDEELICDYLMKWISGCAHPFPSLIQVDLNKCEPWDIPVCARVGGKEWYFYSQRDKKYATGLRTNRATISGYWKATGKDRPVNRKGSLVGMRKTLVFYQGRAPKGRKTDWVMHEFRLEPGPRPDNSAKEDWVLCRVFFKSRQELIIPGKLETAAAAGTSYDVVAPSTPSSLPPLVTQYNNITFDHQIEEQVPCFSIFDQTTLTPAFSLITHTHTHPLPAIPDLGFGYSAPPVTNDDPSSSSCDKKVIRAVLDHLTKMETQNNHHHQCSSSFGEGSSDSYLSEVGLSSMWNHYS